MAGYWMIRSSAIKDAAALQDYVAVWARVAPRFGAEVVAGRGHIETVEGSDFPRQMIIRFPSFEAAKACYDDPEYQASLPLAARAFDREMSILEGV